MKRKTLKYYIRVCDHNFLDTNKIYPEDFYILEMIHDFEVYRVAPSKKHEKDYNNLLERATIERFK